MDKACGSEQQLCLLNYSCSCYVSIPILLTPSKSWNYIITRIWLFASTSNLLSQTGIFTIKTELNEDIPDVRSRKLVLIHLFIHTFIHSFQQTSLCVNELPLFEQVLQANAMVPRALQTYY